MEISFNSVIPVLRIFSIAKADDDLSDEEKLTLVTLLTRNIAQDRHQSSARVRSLKHILFKLDPKPPAQPFSAPKVSAPPDAKRGSVRQRE